MYLNKKLKILDLLIPIISIFIMSFFILDFFPNNKGMIGHDYSVFLNSLFDGRIWFDKHKFDIQWFTPSVGGGLPKFPDPQNMQYSIPQVLANFIHPFLALQISMILFIIIAYYGMYKISKLYNPNPSVFLSHFLPIVFCCSSFLMTRLIIGHLTYHVFCLIPLCSYLTISKKNMAVKTALLSIPIAYIFYGGGGNFFPVIWLSFVALTILIYSTYQLPTPIKDIFLNIFYSTLIGIVIAGPQISASLMFLKNFPRNQVTPPYFDTYLSSIEFILHSLFLNPIEPIKSYFPNLKSPSFFLQQHEVEFSIGVLCLILLVVGAPLLITNLKEQWKRALVIISCFGIPFVFLSILLTQSDFHSELLKNLPYFKSLSSYLRLTAFFIPILCFMSFICAVRVLNSISLKWLKFGFITIIFISSFFNLFSIQTNYYQNQSYHLTNINFGYSAYLEGKFKPQIIGITNQWGNHHFIYNYSSKSPYQPIFGYRLENYPGHRLLPGSPFLTDGKQLNTLNPVCLVFQVENNCNIGDLFLIDQKDALQSFLKYEKFEFKKPILITMSLYLSGLSGGLCIILLIFGSKDIFFKKFNRFLDKDFVD